MSSVKDWKPHDLGTCEVQVLDPNPKEILVENDGIQVGRVWWNEDVLDFEGEAGPSADVVMLAVYKDLGKKEDGSYYSISFAPGSWHERGGVTLYPGAYPNIEGKCSNSMREFLTIVNTLIVKIGR